MSSFIFRFFGGFTVGFAASQYSVGNTDVAFWVVIVNLAIVQLENIFKPR